MVYILILSTISLSLMLIMPTLSLVKTLSLDTASTLAEQLQLEIFLFFFFGLNSQNCLLAFSEGPRPLFLYLAKRRIKTSASAHHLQVAWSQLIFIEHLCLPEPA